MTHLIKVSFRKGQYLMLETRKEYKFIISKSELENFKFFNDSNLVTLHKPRNINSLYLDSWGLDIYKMSDDLDVDKFKYRFRKAIDGKIYSEVKINTANGKFKEKTRTEYQNLEKIESVSYNKMTLYPSLYVSYEREYFNLFDSVRITIDKNITYKSTECRSLVNVNKRTDKIVLEYKYLDDRKLDIENYFFKNPTTFSKYVDGINKVYKESFNL